MLKIYKEIKVDARPKSPATIVNISLPPTQSPSGPIEITSNAPTSSGQSFRDEKSFANEFLATQASVYFRKPHSYPRCISWRVVAASRVLELRAVDLTRSTTCELQEAIVSLRFRFHDSIIPHGVALAERNDDDALYVFVLTTSNQLYTLELQSEFFQEASSLNENITTWCKSYRPAALSFSAPHRLYASTAFEIFVSLQSGALLRLTRKVGEDGSSWSLMTFDERSWGASLRGLVKWTNSSSVPFDNKLLDPNTPNSIAITPDKAFVFIVGLNHSIKVWNLASCRLVASKDLLGRTPQQRNDLPFFLNPEDCAFIRILNSEKFSLDGMYYMVTYSPCDDGHFKFWVVKGGLTGQLEIEDLFPESNLQTADLEPSGGHFWNLIDFQIAPADEGRDMALWVLWGSNAQYQLHSLRFNFSNLPDAWRTKWTKMALELHHDLPQSLIQPSLTDLSEEWLNFIFSPKKYPIEVLETALAVFAHSIKCSGTSTFSCQLSLRQRISRVIQDSVILRKLPDAVVDFSRYCKDLDITWRQFWHVTEVVNRRRFESISLAYDPHSDIPWIIFTDGFALVRECSATEILLHNEADSVRANLQFVERDWPHRNLLLEIGAHAAESATLISIAASFRRRLSPELIQSCDIALSTEVLVEASLSAAERLVAFHQRCGFADLLTDEMYDATFASIDHLNGFEKLCNDLFFTVIDTVCIEFSRTDSELLFTEFGLTVTMEGTMENIVLTRQIVRDLLLLAVFVEVEVDCENFKGPDLFTTLVSLLREYEILAWLGSNNRTRSTKGPNLEVKGDARSSDLDTVIPCKSEVSVLEDIFAARIKPRPAAGVSQMYVLMQQVSDVLSWTTRHGALPLEDILVFIQSSLIASGDVNLATDFLRFQPDTGWSTYIKGRLYLTRRDFDEAAVNFQRASYALAYGKPTGDLQEMSSKLVDVISTHSFYNGLPEYFLHIMQLFEHARSFSHVAYFAGISLQTAPLARGAIEETNNSQFNLVSHLLSAQLKMRHFDEAYTTLSNILDPAFRDSARKTLVATILATCGPSAVALKKFRQLPFLVDLLSLCQTDDVLGSPAKTMESSVSFVDRPLSDVKLEDSFSLLKALYVAKINLESAAKTSYQRLCVLRHVASGAGRYTKQHLEVTQDYRSFSSVELITELLTLINLLASMESAEPYFIGNQNLLMTNNTSNENQGFEQGAPSSAPVDGAFDTVMLQPATEEPKSYESPSDRELSDNITLSTSKHGSSFEDSTYACDRLFLKQHASSGCAIVTLESLRREYQLELDRVCRIQNGDWEYGQTDH